MWREITLSLPVGADYATTKKKLTAAVTNVLKDDREEILRHKSPVELDLMRAIILRGSSFFEYWQALAIIVLLLFANFVLHWVVPAPTKFTIKKRKPALTLE